MKPKACVAEKSILFWQNSVQSVASESEDNRLAFAAVRHLLRFLGKGIAANAFDLSSYSWFTLHEKLIRTGGKRIKCESSYGRLLMGFRRSWLKFMVLWRVSRRDSRLFMAHSCGTCERLVWVYSGCAIKLTLTTVVWLDEIVTKFS